MRKSITKVMCVLLLIPILGLGLPFGSAYIYGKIRHAEKRTTVICLLDAHENELLEIVKDKTINTKKSDLLKTLLGLDKTSSEKSSMLEQLGFERLIQAENKLFFQLPYTGKPGSWVPCGLLYSNDSAAIESWKKTSPIRGDWYFYWEP